MEVSSSQNGCYYKAQQRSPTLAPSLAVVRSNRVDTRYASGADVSQYCNISNKLQVVTVYTIVY